MITLAVDASTYQGTVAVLDDTRVVLEQSAPMRGRDAEHLMPAVDAALRDAGHTVASIHRVVCGAGPGSFTSLRIAASIAKGIAVGRRIPLYAVSSLALIVAGNVKDGPRGTRRYLATLDALRGEHYVALFDHDAGVVSPAGELQRVPADEVQALADRENARAVGPDQADAWRPHARGVALLAAAIEGEGPVDLASWEPIYGRLAEAQVKWEAAHGRSLSG
ncbi:MAG TPA: tRNA (adenosine(37)-N6)-threonylcarbamoyltransferase complex dimerization subunit type 1 TsaB [Gemmatimonadaceae bacterium]|nr:tRNA (adenosine(37)-N6)-threonylcarbamoyltransferase complex dimerization subunit type 1 TsaB [Gemmatimonadaceae bacterium]